VISSLRAVTGAGRWSLRTAFFCRFRGIALVVILSTELNVRSVRPEDRWYDGRALAESAKSLVWRYSVGGLPFGTTKTRSVADSSCSCHGC
jgi:hypothetical protein